MAPTRHFIGWTDPVVRGVGRFLLPDPIRGTVDFEDTLIVVPTRQAGRRLRDHLAQACADAGVALLSTRIVPPSALLTPPHPPPDEAGPLLIGAVWTSVLRDLDISYVPALFPNPPSPVSPQWAAQAGEMVQTLRRTLAEAGYRIADVVARHGEILGEPDRWRDLAELEHRFLAALSARKRSDPLLNRLALAENPPLPQAVSRIILAAVPDVNALTLRILDRLSERVTVDILVAAPEDEAHRFDDWGRPLPEAWADAILDIPNPDRAIIVAGTPADQAKRVVREMAEAPAQFGPADIAIGVPDRAVIPFLAAALDDCGLAAFDPADRSVRDTAVYGLLRAYGTFMIERRYDSLAALLRHPDLLAHLEATHGLSPTAVLRELDEFQNRHLPLDISDVTRALPGRRASRGSRSDAFGSLNEAVSLLLDNVDAFEQQDIETAIRGFLRTLYESRVIANGDDTFERIARHVDDALHELADADTKAVLHDAPTAFALFLKRLGDQSIPAERGEVAIDLEGWFELPWNDAPYLVVTGMNEGCVPATGPANLFLPDSLRRALGCPADADRLARDAWLMRTLIEGRRVGGHVCFIVGKTGAAGDVLRPSRLLLRTADDDLAKRAARLFGAIPPKPADAPETLSFQLNPQPPPDIEPGALNLTHLPVTAFRDYLSCPFRFYLKRVLGMEALDDAKRELDALDFGNLVHDALCDMAHDPIQRDATDPEALGAFLAARASAWVQDRFGTTPPLSVSIGLDAAVQRLRAAARVQVELQQAGWRIQQAETRFEAEIDGITIIGRIDRIDVHTETGRVRVIDYKTSDTTVIPDKSHLAPCRADTPDAWQLAQDKRTARWIDLQLPLYLILLPDSFGDDVETAYFNLPKAVTHTGVVPWEGLDASGRASADACARDVIRRIRERVFWPPTERVDYDDFESLFYGGADAFRPLSIP